MMNGNGLPDFCLQSPFYEEQPTGVCFGVQKRPEYMYSTSLSVMSKACPRVSVAQQRFPDCLLHTLDTQYFVESASARGRSIVSVWKKIPP